MGKEWSHGVSEECSVAGEVGSSIVTLVRSNYRHKDKIESLVIDIEELRAVVAEWDRRCTAANARKGSL